MFFLSFFLSFFLKKKVWFVCVGYRWNMLRNMLRNGPFGVDGMRRDEALPLQVPSLLFDSPLHVLESL